MIIGIPREIKDNEFRVGMNPESVRELTHHGHHVLVEHDAGIGIGATDENYRQAGAIITDSASDLYANAKLIIKVKEPQPVERAMLRPDQILFTCLHLAADAEQTRDLLASGTTCIAYETVTAHDGSLPLLTPMSEVAGRLSAQVGANYLERINGGSGKLLGGVPGVEAANVVIIGGGVVGRNAAMIAFGMHARVTVIDRSAKALEQLDHQFSGQVNTEFSTRHSLEKWVAQADLLIGSVLLPGAKAPKLVSREMIASMQPGSVAVDVAIDQGGCFETSRPTRHSNPTYVAEGVVHYCVTNMPGAVPLTATRALNNATLPFALALADNGIEALRNDPNLRNGLNIMNGKVTNPNVATALGYDYSDPSDLLH
jgi:alanine dehydrogenase